jgi:hypothetical protein
MTMAAFARKYPTPAQGIDAVVRRWVTRREVRDFLGMPILAGVTTLDLLMGDQLVDTLSPEVKHAFKTLMEVKADSRAEVERLILEKIERGDESVRGLMNKIQGQIGEEVFVRLAGPAARLAENKSQEGWDVCVDRGDHAQYVQVKVYADADGLSQHLGELQEKLLAGTIRDGETPLTRLDIAVNSEIYEEVRANAEALGYPGEILDLGETRAVMRDALEQSVGPCQLVERLVSRSPGVPYSAHGQRIDQPLQESSLSGRDHQPRGVALFPLLLELSRCRGAAVQPGSHGHVRSHPEMVS